MFAFGMGIRHQRKAALDSDASTEQQLWRICLMKRVIVVGVAASAMAISVLTMVGVAATVPMGPSEVDDTVRTLEEDGYHVIVNRVGVVPLSSCTVSAVRPGPKTVSETVYVDVAC
jgi:hypothetical protein